MPAPTPRPMPEPWQMGRLAESLRRTTTRIEVAGDTIARSIADLGYQKGELGAAGLSGAALAMMRYLVDDPDRWSALSEDRYDFVVVRLACRIMLNERANILRRAIRRRDPRALALLESGHDTSHLRAAEAARRFREKTAEWRGPHRRVLEAILRLGDVSAVVLADDLNLSAAYVQRLLRDIRGAVKR